VRLGWTIEQQAPGAPVHIRTIANMDAFLNERDA